MWTDHGAFFEHNAPQGTKAWKEARIGVCTGSVSGALAGNSRFKNPEETGKIIANVEEEKFTEEALERMNYGHKYEPEARKWYENAYKCKVLERNLCRSKEDFRIGASVDGDIINKNGIIEIKCPQKMYRPLISYMDMKASGWIPPSNYYDHIWPTHLDQCFHGMYVLKRDFCDYIVYCPEEGKIFTQRINFDLDYWNNHYAKLSTNYDLYVKPYLLPGYPISIF